MTLEHYTYPRDFADFAVPLLEKNEAVNNLPLGILAALQRWPELASKALMLGLSSGSAHLLALRSPPGHLVLAETDGALELLPELCAWLVAHQPDIGGVVASLELARAFAEAWPGQSRVEMEQKLYQLTEVIHPQAIPGHFRLAAIGDLGMLLSWAEAFLAEALPNEKHNSEKLRQKTLNQIQAGDLGIWEVNDKLVSMAARTRGTRTGTAINLVYTPPELRGHGYASACVASPSQIQLDQGKAFCCLYTDLSNPTSNSIYAKIGYRPIKDMLMMFCEVPNNG